MFKFLSDWMNKSPEEHIKNSLTLVGISTLLWGGSLVFPAVAPALLGVSFATAQLSMIEVGIGAGTAICNGVSWLFNKIFRRKNKQNTAKQSNSKISTRNNSMDHSKTNQNEIENPNESAQSNLHPIIENSQFSSQAAPVTKQAAPNNLGLPTNQMALLTREITQLKNEIQQLTSQIHVLKNENANLKREKNNLLTKFSPEKNNITNVLSSKAKHSTKKTVHQKLYTPTLPTTERL